MLLNGARTDIVLALGVSGGRADGARTATGALLIWQVHAYPPNELTLSCKDRLPCRSPTDGAAAAATNMQ